MFRGFVTVHGLETASFFGSFRAEKCAYPFPAQGGQSHFRGLRRENGDSPRERFRGFLYLACSTLTALAIVTGAFSQQVADPYKEALGYKFDQPRTAVMAIEAEIRTAKPEQLRTIEGRLLQILQSPKATTDAKSWVCRQLRQAGSEQSVNALAPLLADKELATVARLALQSIPGPKVDEALRDAARKVRGDLLAGVLQTIGMRGDRQALSLIIPLASDQDSGVAEAALFALGHIGGPEAFAALRKAKVPDSLNRCRFDAMLRSAERMGTAEPYRFVFAQSDDPVIQTGALRGIVLHDKPGAAAELLACLKSQRQSLRAAAAKFACELGGERVLSTVLAELASLPVESQTLILDLVADKSALPAVLTAAKSDHLPVRKAAISALGRVGDASCMPVLLSLAAGQTDVAADARASLRALRGAGIAEALVAAAQSGQRAERIAAINALAARGHVEATPVLVKIAEASDGDVQSEAFLALGALADQPTLPALVDLLVRAKHPRVRADAERALAAACARASDKNAASQALAASLSSPSLEIRRSVMKVLAGVPSQRSLEILRAATREADEAIRDAAIRGLAAWPDAAAAEDLLAIARSEKTPKYKILALQGAIRLAGPAGKLPLATSLKLLTEAMSLAERNEERKLVLAALSEVSHPEAVALAARWLAEPALEVEAAAAVVKIAKSLRVSNPDAAAAAIQQVLDACKSPATRQAAESAMIVLDRMVNIAPQGTASSPDGLDKDGAAGDDQAAIDGDPATYWDEKDGQPLYRLLVTFKQPETIAAISILGYQHHAYAPKDFEILCDGKTVKKVENAQYNDNFLLLRLDAACTTVELKITGYYGQSPAIRELGIYRAKSAKRTLNGKP